MRQLNRKQKELLKEWFTWNRGKCSLTKNNVQEIPFELWERIQEINDHETIYQNISNYLNELLMELD